MRNLTLWNLNWAYIWARRWVKNFWGGVKTLWTFNRALQLSIALSFVFISYFFNIIFIKGPQPVLKILCYIYNFFNFSLKLEKDFWHVARPFYENDILQTCYVGENAFVNHLKYVFSAYNVFTPCQKFFTPPIISESTLV